MKNWKTLVALVLTVVLSCSSALACTSLYVGSGFTEDGATILARSEDLANSRNKVYYVSPAGNHKAGEFYQGCYGFTYTFKVATGLAYFSEEKPEIGAFYPATSRVKTEDGTVTVEGYRVLPEKWDESYYWTVDAISNIMKYGTPSDEVKALVVDSLAAKQQEIYDAFITMNADIAAAEDPAKVSTDASMAMAYDVFEMLSGLAKELTK